MAELKRVNRLLNENDFYAKKTIKIPVKAASLLTEILPFTEKPKNSNWNTKTPAKSRSSAAAILDVQSDGSRGKACGHSEGGEGEPAPRVKCVWGAKSTPLGVKSTLLGA